MRTCDTRLLNVYEVWLEHALRSFEALGANLDCPAIWELEKRLRMVFISKPRETHSIALNEHGCLF